MLCACAWATPRLWGQASQKSYRISFSFRLFSLIRSYMGSSWAYMHAFTSTHIFTHTHTHTYTRTRTHTVMSAQGKSTASHPLTDYKTSNANHSNQIKSAFQGTYAQCYYNDKGFQSICNFYLFYSELGDQSKLNDDLDATTRSEILHQLTRGKIRFTVE